MADYEHLIASIGRLEAMIQNNQEEMLDKMETNQEKMIAKMDAHQEKMERGDRGQ
jgi:hypothetical protein